MLKKCTVIVVCHNSKRHIKDCLKMLGKDYPITLVDNNSDDNTIAIARSLKLSNLSIIAHEKNPGYGAAANIGLAKVKTKYALVINPDIRITPKSIQSLVSFIELKKCDVIGPKMLGFDGALQYSCRRFPTLCALFGRQFNLFKKSVNRYMMKEINHNNAQVVDWVSGGCILFHSKFRFDERFFLYFDDVDFCHEKKVWYYPDVSVLHEEQRDSARKLRYLYIHVMSAIKYYLKRKNLFFD